MCDLKEKRSSKARIFSMICMICLLFTSIFAFSSCDSETSPGVLSASINENGELILIYQDGTEHNLGVVVGQDGKDGADGVDGEDGKDGADGTSNSSGSIVINNENGSSTAFAASKALRSAVSIVCNFTKTVQTSGHRPGSNNTSTSSYSSAGSGVIYELDMEEGDAFIITNYHVVYDSSSNTANGVSDDISVYLYGSEDDDMAMKATYVGGSLYYDIAVLYIDDSDTLKSSCAAEVDVANSEEIVVGNTAIAIGNAAGYGISASFGAVSVDSEYITMTAADGSTTVSFRVMRVDTAVNSGNSGGGLFNDEGKLIGIVNAKIVEDGVENIGYAIPSNVAVSVAENIIKYCYETEVESVQRCILGITVSSSGSHAVFDSVSGTIRIEETVSVYEITDGALAEGVLQEGDVIVSASVTKADAGESFTKEITRQYHIIDLVLDVHVGDSLVFTVLRDGNLTILDGIVITEDCIISY